MCCFPGSVCEWSVSATPPVSSGRPGRCPDCRKQARRVHSSYQRRLDERRLGSRRVVVRLRVRRYFCDGRRCVRKTFVEQVPGLTERHHRSSVGLTRWLRSIAVELGGRPAARLCRRLRLPAGRTRLPSLLTAPPVQSRAPRVLGVDEFAFRKGCTYGTVLVDVEAGRVVDVLPDRTSETFAAWLRDHPGAEIVCRDRATAYTKAVKEAAPNALKVADRWHLLQNLSAAVEKTCHQHHNCLREYAEQETEPTVPEPVPMELPVPELPRTQIIERTRHRFEAVHRLAEKGWTISAIGSRLNLDRKTVRRFRDTDLDQLLACARDRRPNGVLEPFKAYLNARFTETQGQMSGTRAGRPEADAGLRWLPPPGPRRRHRRPHPRMEFRRRRRTREPGENTQASHVSPGLVRDPPHSHPHSAIDAPPMGLWW
ncbi:ISL3 family transposase [Streptomyces sp. NPDC048415]|uniref:ISL3 family transposase n=1 Tax=Streptomyces sp. NPDC048415 TaxID=3154822 RepID=UPI0034411C15